MTPKISVVMPIYNSQRYLRSAVESVIRQTETDWELLCVDDGSTDDSMLIVQEMANKDSRIISIPREHRGIVDTLNYAIQLCRCPFIARLDSDDLAMPERFALQLHHLQTRPHVGMVAGAYETVDEHGNIWKTQQSPQDVLSMKKALRKSNCVAHSSVMFRKDVVSKFDGPYRSQFPLAEDYDLWLRMIESVPIESIPEVIIQYRRDLQASSAQRLVRQTLSSLGCQFAHTCRENGIGDPSSPWVSSDRHELLGSGIPKARIDKEVRRRLLSEARTMRKFGYMKQAESLVDAVKEFAPGRAEVAASLDYAWRLIQIRNTRIEPRIQSSSTNKAMA